MQLEKATSPGGEAGLAGWISSNDVTLFTVVLVVVIAVFLQANVIKGSKRNVQLEGDKATLASELTDKKEELDKEKSELEQKRRELEDTSQRLEDTIQVLSETSEQLKKTELELAATKKERDDLENVQKELDEKLTQTRSDVQNLSMTLDALNLEKSKLTEQKKDLTEVKAQLDEDLADLSAKLKERLSQLDDMKKERDLLDEKAKALNDRVARLEQQLGDNAETMEELKKSSQSEMESLKSLLARALERNKADQAVSAKELQDTRARAQEASERAEDYLGRLQRAADYVKGINENKQMLQLQVDALKVQLANALDDLKESQQQLSQSLSREKSVNRELVGLRGGLRRVAILFDSSGSMGQDGRWEEVQRIASTWLDHLNVDECVLIVFSDEAKAFPADGSMLRVSGPNGDANRIRLMNHLRSVQPTGWTNTLAAMQKAYGYADLDTIILFSDGAPTYAGRNEFNAEAAQQIYALCQRHSKIPINAIGLGDYFDKELSTFLRTVAHLTGGTFLGR